MRNIKFLIKNLFPRTILLICLVGLLTIPLINPNYEEKHIERYIESSLQSNFLGCYTLPLDGILQDAVNQFDCVQLGSGTWNTTAQISMPTGHKLIGVGRDSTILKAIAPWQGNGTGTPAAVVHNNSNSAITISNLTVDANNLSLLGIADHGITVDNVRVTGAKCDGIGIAGSGMVVQNSLIENNGKQCDYTGNPGSGIYMTRQLNDFGLGNYTPLIYNNTIQDNGGPGIDIDRVWGGVAISNTITNNQAWAAFSLYSSSNWTIKNNIIQHPINNNYNMPGHAYCSGGSSGNYAAALALCQDTEKSNEVVTSNLILNNQIVGWYGIKVIGKDEVSPFSVPTSNLFQGNNIYGSVVGCADDTEIDLNPNSINMWVNNNCAGKSNTLPLYFNVACPSAVNQNKIQEWNIGATDLATVDNYIQLFNQERTGGGDFLLGAKIPAGMVIATNLGAAGADWTQLPLKPLVNYQNYGLFETTGEYTAVYAGACMTIAPFFNVSESSDYGDFTKVGTLSWALKNALAGQIITLFDPNQININTQLLPLPAGVKLIGNCDSNGSGVTLDGSLSGNNQSGLILSGDNLIYGLKIIGFQGKSINSNRSKNNRLNCLVIKK
ncbi:MAG: right-handed parallel beta-helix repeat-containing protein [Chloroflexi bacterium]|nr:right-handed parallel beta-helix repeat-containing protein [Chloroflexota bacterium]